MLAKYFLVFAHRMARATRINLYEGALEIRKPREIHSRERLKGGVSEKKEKT